VTNPTFACGHAKTPKNTVVRKRSGKAKHQFDYLNNPAKGNQLCCRTCYNRRMAAAQARRRARLQAFKDELYHSLPPQLPPIESC
jgi:hypothetical protein